MNDSRRDRTFSAPLGADAKHPPARLGDEGWPAFVRRRGAARIDAGRSRLPFRSAWTIQFSSRYRIAFAASRGEVRRCA